MSEILTVFGSTGNQGGSVIKSVLAHPELSKRYKIRAVTRDPSKPAGQALASQGCEVVKGDLDDPKSLAEVVKDSSAVFGVTNFWETISKDVEVRQGKAIADASKAANVKHLIWSSALHVTETTNGKLPHVLHFDGKAEVESYIRSLEIPASFFIPGPFTTVMTSDLVLSKDGNGFKMCLPISDTDTIPLFHPPDSGKWVAGMLLADDAVFGKRIAASNGFYTGHELAMTVEEMTGAKTVFEATPYNIWRERIPEMLRNELGETFLFIRDWKYYGDGSEKQVEDGWMIMVGEPTTFAEAVKQSDPLHSLM